MMKTKLGLLVEFVPLLGLGLNVELELAPKLAIVPSHRYNAFDTRPVVNMSSDPAKFQYTNARAKAN